MGWWKRLNDWNERNSDRNYIIAIIVLGILFVLGSAYGIFISKGGVQNLRAKRLFNSTTLTESTDRPVVKVPYTVFEQDEKGIWRFCYRGAEYDDDAIKSRINAARTCVFVWADTDHPRFSDKEWKSWGGGATRARCCTTYITVIDREGGVRYEDVELGEAYFEPGINSKLATPLYASSNFDLGDWIDRHTSDE